jgi:hypothetical protein
MGIAIRARQVDRRRRRREDRGGIGDKVFQRIE